MAYYGRQPSQVEVDSHYALLSMVIEDGLRVRMPVVDILNLVDGKLRELRNKNYIIARETGIKMNMIYGRTFYPFRFRT